VSACSLRNTDPVAGSSAACRGDSDDPALSFQSDRNALPGLQAGRRLPRSLGVGGLDEVGQIIDVLIGILFLEFGGDLLTGLIGTLALLFERECTPPELDQK
jgi:hypothetical protein